MPTRSSAASAYCLSLRRRHAAIGQRQLDVFENGEITDEVEALKDETDLAIANARAFRKRKVRDFAAFERVAAIRRRVEQAEDREERRLSATGRTGDGKIFALANVEMNAGERVRLHFIGEKNFRHALQLNEHFGAIPVRAMNLGLLFR